MATRRLSEDYERDYGSLLRDVQAEAKLQGLHLTNFWPKIGRLFDGNLMIVGRAVNGWIDNWQPSDSADVAMLAATARATGEDGVNGDPLGWVLQAWQRGNDQYNTSRSQFWETIRRVVTTNRAGVSANWPAQIAWTNLYKVAPWTGGNPSARLRRAQLPVAVRLLEREVAELDPSTVVVFAGRWWFEPFASALGLGMVWQDGLVEGVADSGGRRWVVAVHPMTRSPAAVAHAVIRALGSSSALNS